MMKEATFRSALFYSISTIPVIGLESLKRAGLSYVTYTNNSASSSSYLNIALMLIAFVFAFGSLIIEFIVTNR